MVNENLLTDVSNLDDLIQHFGIHNLLFDRNFSKCRNLINSRRNYFLFRKQQWKVVDHGILGGLLLFDRLVKIRREKKKENEDNLFCVRKLENQYKLAANAISIHNIWLPTNSTKKIYEKFNLKDLLNFQAIKFEDFPMFYILGVADTIEPLKTFKVDNFSDIYILKNLYMDFKQNSITISNGVSSKLDFSKLLAKTKYFENWLAMEIKTNNESFELIFK